MDYVALLDSSMDSDTPLAEVRLRRNAPGTPLFKWRKKDAVPLRYGFSGNEGINLQSLHEDSTPREIFDAFFSPDLWTTMAVETNRYQAQHPATVSGHMKRWVDVDEAEMQRYIGIRLLMGIHKLPSFHSFWSTRRTLASPFFNENMTRDRFDTITAKLHFVDNNDLDPEGDLRKLRPVVDVLQHTFKTVYTPGNLTFILSHVFYFHATNDHSS